MTHRYLHGPLVDQVLADEKVDATPGTADDVRWALSDHQQSVRRLVKSDGTAVADILYDSFGKVPAGTTTPDAVDFLFGYTGQQYDKETGLSYYKARYYDPQTSHFLSEDPAHDGVNPYRYVGNDPLNRVDPTGLATSYLGGGLGSTSSSFFLGGLGNYSLPSSNLATAQASNGLGVNMSNLFNSVAYSGNLNSPAIEYQQPAPVQTAPTPYSSHLNDSLLAGSLAGGLVTSLSSLPQRQVATMTFFRGTTLGSALETVQSQAFDVSRIASLQALTGQTKTGVYLTTQEATAQYFADIAGMNGRGLGPAVVRVKVPQAQFETFAKANSIRVETPIERLPGMTETRIPFENVRQLESMAKLSQNPAPGEAASAGKPAVAGATGTAARTSAARTIARSVGNMAKGGVVQSGGELLLDNFLHPGGNGGFHTDYSAQDQAKSAQMERIKAEGREATFAEKVSVPGPGGTWWGRGPAPSGFEGAAVAPWNVNARTWGIFGPWWRGETDSWW